MSASRSVFVASVFACAVASAAPKPEECTTDAAGRAYVTGHASASTIASSMSLRRLYAERAAFLDAVRKLRTCVKAKGGKPITGWSILAVRYFDSDPTVEADVSPRFDPVPVVTVMGAATPSVNGTTVDEIRLDTTKAAVATARRNAKEALDVAFPTEAGPGSVRQTLVGSLEGCTVSEVTYWDDNAVSVKVSCGQGVVANQAPEKKGQPTVYRHK